MDDSRYQPVLENMRARLAQWMKETDDPLLHGSIPAPNGAVWNNPDDLSPNDLLFRA
jgi:N-sulfoglucosamine sulfohydrolase